jgi:hypothetical protein
VVWAAAGATSLDMQHETGRRWWRATCKERKARKEEEEGEEEENR